MKFKFQTWEVEYLIDIISKQKINLKPSYQRNFIWGKKDRNLLIETIMKGYPLPSFFIYQNNSGIFEMVDGQQRSTTIYRYYSEINELKKANSITDTDLVKFLNYPLNITLIYDLTSNDSLEKFYTLVNRSGYHLNPNELNRAQFHDSIFLELVERLVDSDELRELDIFSEASKIRMNDRALIEEIVAWMVLGISDKRKAVTSIYNENNISKDDSDLLYAKVVQVFKKLLELNDVKPINITRYCQRNDFFTLFQFVYQNQDESDEVLQYQYRILLLIEKYIRPTQERCLPLKNYALNCVTQTNSKLAREGRLNFFNMILKNSDVDGSEELNQTLEFLEDIFGIEEESKLIPINSYYLMNVKFFNND